MSTTSPFITRRAGTSSSRHPLRIAEDHVSQRRAERLEELHPSLTRDYFVPQSPHVIDVANHPNGTAAASIAEGPGVQEPG
jgi:hypothetical protein